MTRVVGAATGIRRTRRSAGPPAEARRAGAPPGSPAGAPGARLSAGSSGPPVAVGAGRLERVAGQARGQPEASRLAVAAQAELLERLVRAGRHAVAGDAGVDLVAGGAAL